MCRSTCSGSPPDSRPLGTSRGRSTAAERRSTSLRRSPSLDRRPRPGCSVDWSPAWDEESGVGETAPPQATRQRGKEEGAREVHRDGRRARRAPAAGAAIVQSLPHARRSLRVPRCVRRGIPAQASREGNRVSVSAAGAIYVERARGRRPRRGCRAARPRTKSRSTPSSHGASSVGPSNEVASRSRSGKR